VLQVLQRVKHFCPQLLPALRELTQGPFRHECVHSIENRVDDGIAS
jgi:hypothetical protein